MPELLTARSEASTFTKVVTQYHQFLPDSKTGDTPIEQANTIDEEEVEQTESSLNWLQLKLVDKVLPHITDEPGSHSSARFCFYLENLFILIYIPRRL